MTPLSLNPQAKVYLPVGGDYLRALQQTTHLGIGAHQDDLEFMAYEGIQTCYQRSDLWFSGIILTDGRGSSRAGIYRDWTDEAMAAERSKEQEHAARIGQYASLTQLGYRSSEVKNPNSTSLQNDLVAILAQTRPQVVYLHNPADEHETHVASLIHCIQALRKIPQTHRPHQVLGCEVWRGLDWLLDNDKVLMDVSRFPELANQLNQIFQTQIAGGKNYPQAIVGRRLANATFHQSHQPDRLDAIQWAMDLTPLMQNDSLDIAEFTAQYLERFKQDVLQRLARFTPPR